MGLKENRYFAHGGKSTLIKSQNTYVVAECSEYEKL